jgi:hypothetical protein
MTVSRTMKNQRVMGWIVETGITQPSGTGEETARKGFTGRLCRGIYDEPA